MRIKIGAIRQLLAKMNDAIADGPRDTASSSCVIICHNNELPVNKLARSQIAILSFYQMMWPENKKCQCYILLHIVQGGSYSGSNYQSTCLNNSRNYFNDSSANDLNS